jgi:hypothetical protein
METLAKFFDRINATLGVTTTEELVFHPYFIAFMVVAFLYGAWKGYKWLSVPILGIGGGAALYAYMWPSDTSKILDLVKFFLAAAGMGVLLVYIAFIREK